MQVMINSQIDLNTERNRTKFTSVLTVTINGIKNHQGQVCLSLFDREQGFPNDGNNAIQAYCVEVIDSQLEVKFPNLQAGNYAVAVFHDANNDGTLNRNWLGIPTEGFGFSQNPNILKGIPKFSASAIKITNSNKNIEISLQYIL
jgi:uncharacterized protein (DUF2141 family)